MRPKRFENATQLRAGVESRLNRQLSHADWQAIAPSWSPPYDLPDVQDVAERALDLPPLREERVRNLAADVERLKTQIADYDPLRLDGSPLFLGSVSIGELYRHIATENDDGENADLAPLYREIGRLVHEALAVDWLAEKHGLMMGTGLSLLTGSFDPDEAAQVQAMRPRRSYAKMVLSKLPSVGRLYSRGYEKGLRMGAAKAKGPMTDTDQVVLEATRQARSVFRADAGWADIWEIYEATRLACLAEPDVFSEGLRSFTGWRAFRVAVKRAERRAAQSAA